VIQIGTTTRIVLRQNIIVSKQTQEGLIYEGELPLSDQQQADLKQLLGDGLAKVTASVEMSESDFGSGGKTFCAVTLTCDQSINAIEGTHAWAFYFARKYAEEQHAVLKESLVAKGILKP
jgi:hypothetical protein